MHREHVVVNSEFIGVIFIPQFVSIVVMFVVVGCDGIVVGCGVTVTVIVIIIVTFSCSDDVIHF